MACSCTILVSIWGPPARRLAALSTSDCWDPSMPSELWLLVQIASAVVLSSEELTAWHRRLFRKAKRMTAVTKGISAVNVELMRDCGDAGRVRWSRFAGVWREMRGHPPARSVPASVRSQSRGQQLCLVSRTDCSVSESPSSNLWAAAQGEAWRPSGTRSGSVRLSLEGRSAATVEATWVPTSPGMLPMPQLLLPDIPHQEVFDVGDSNHLITVA